MLGSGNGNLMRGWIWANLLQSRRIDDERYPECMLPSWITYIPHRVVFADLLRQAFSQGAARPILSSHLCLPPIEAYQPSCSRIRYRLLTHTNESVLKTASMISLIINLR
jgi:hypothetical protein